MGLSSPPFTGAVLADDMGLGYASFGSAQTNSLSKYMRYAIYSQRFFQGYHVLRKFLLGVERRCKSLR